MFLRCKARRKDGKQHRYWSVVENTRTARGRVVQRHVLYLGEINDTQELAWRRSIEVLEEGDRPNTTAPPSIRFSCCRDPGSGQFRRVAAGYVYDQPRRTCQCLTSVRIRVG